MLTLTPLPPALTGDPRFDAGISDLMVTGGPSGPVLVSVSAGKDSGVVSWQLADGAAPEVQETTATRITTLTATGPGIVTAGDRVLVAGTDPDAVRSGTLTQNGALKMDGLRDAGQGRWSVAAATDTTLALAEADGTGVTLFSLAGSGALTALGTVSDTARTHARDIGAMAFATVDGQDILLTASTSEHGVSAWRVAPPRMEAAGRAGPAEGLGLMVPTDIAVVEVDGRHFALIASAPGGAGRSGALSVLEVDARGDLTPRDHVTDSLDSRFGQVQSLSVLQHEGRTLVAAGGGDDGLSLFSLTGDGRLIHLTAFADTDATRLTGITALAMSVTGEELQIHAASAEGAGLTTLRADLDDLGEIRTAPETDTGTGARLQAGPRGDILIDGAGADTLTGGDGADLFVISADGQRNEIRAFDPAEDHIDLGSWPLIHDPAALRILSSGAGVRVQGAGQTLDIRGTGNTPLDPEAVRAAITLSASRSFAVPSARQEGSAGADRLTGSWGFDTLTGGAGDDTLAGGGGDDRIIGGSGRDRVEFSVKFSSVTVLRAEGDSVTISSSEGTDVISGVEVFAFRDQTLDIAGLTAPREIRGTTRADRLEGSDRNDSLVAEAGDDTIRAGRGDDHILAGDGADDIWGDGGNDTILGGKGDDILRGGREEDEIWGGDGHDIIRGQSHADLLYGHGGDDNIKGGGGNDTLSGGNGSDFLKGGTRRDMVIGGDGDDILAGNLHDDTLRGGDGSDRLKAGGGDDDLDGGQGDDILKGGAGADRFVFRRGDGNDRILDFDPGADRLVLSADLTGGLSASRIADRAEATDVGVLLAFGADTILLQGVTGTAGLAGAIEIL